MYKGGVCRVRGIGEDVEEMECDKKLCFDLIIAEGGADSGACYRRFDLLNPVIRSSNPPKNVQEAIDEARNDLIEASCIVNPRIKESMDKLRAQGYDKVYMSGSGSAVFAITDQV